MLKVWQDCVSLKTETFFRFFFYSFQISVYDKEPQFHDLPNQQNECFY